MHSSWSSSQLVHRAPFAETSHRTFLVLHDRQALEERCFTTRESASSFPESFRFRYCKSKNAPDSCDVARVDIAIQDPVSKKPAFVGSAKASSIVADCQVAWLSISM